MAIDKNNKNNSSGYTSKTSDPVSSGSFQSGTNTQSGSYGSSNYSGSQSYNTGSTGSQSGTFSSGSQAGGISSGMNTNSSFDTQSRQGMSQSPIDNIPDAVGQVVDQIFRALQPRVHEFALSWANRLVGVSDQSARQLVTRAKSRPMYTIGAIALLVVGLGIVLGNDQRSRGMSPHELH